jgi:hypothetical protein
MFGSIVVEKLMETEKLEISDICVELRKLTKAPLADRTNAACAQAASLLEILRETIIASRSNDPGVQRLKSILAAQGEG